MVVFAVLAAVTAVQRHREYRTYRNDLGNMVQVVDNTAHGRILQMTSSDGRQISRLASHVDPILALFALPWLVWPDPAMLLVTQAVLVALAAWPVVPARPPRPRGRGGRGALRRRGAPLPSAAVRRARRVPPGHARHPPAAVRVRLPRGGPALARHALPRARRAVQGGGPAGDRADGPVLRAAQAHAVAAARDGGGRAGLPAGRGGRDAALQRRRRRAGSWTGTRRRGEHAQPRHGPAGATRGARSRRCWRRPGSPTW